MSLSAVPGAIEPKEVQDFLARLPGVARIHDFHVWPMSTTEVALTCHLVMPDGHPGDDFTLQAARTCTTVSASATRRSRSKSARTIPASWSRTTSV